jgi:predicted amidohydrolase
VSDVLRVGAVQLTTSDDRDRNVAVAGELVARAAEQGARLVALPEKWHFIHDEKHLSAAAEPLDGPSVQAARGWARELGIAILAGSIVERVDGEVRSHNTSVLIRADGSVAATYRKLHLFDVEVGGVTYRESAGAIPGEDIVVGEALGRRIGMSVCYDLRFPELYRAHAARGARFLAVPSAFARETGRDHWEVLLRARAIENQAFVLAPAQWGRHGPERSSHGRSLVVDPWGVVLAQAPDRPCVVVADCDPDHQDRVRAALPCLGHRTLG